MLSAAYLWDEKKYLFNLLHTYFLPQITPSPSECNIRSPKPSGSGRSYLCLCFSQIRWIYLCGTPVTWSFRGSFLQIDSRSIPRVKEFLQGTGNTYCQELNSILLHLNPVPEPQISSFLLADSPSSGCKAVWPVIHWTDYQNREDSS